MVRPSARHRRGGPARLEGAASPRQNVITIRWVRHAPVDRNSRYSGCTRADAHFHDAILKVAGNEVTRHALSSQHLHLHIFRLMFHARVTAEALTEHDRLLAAFRAGDAEAAEQEMRGHIRRSHDRLIAAFD